MRVALLAAVLLTGCLDDPDRCAGPLTMRIDERLGDAVISGAGGTALMTADANGLQDAVIAGGVVKSLIDLTRTQISRDPQLASAPTGHLLVSGRDGDAGIGVSFDPGGAVVATFQFADKLQSRP